MTPQEFRSKMGGVIAFPVTPFKTDLSLDIAGLRSNLRKLREHRFAAVVAAGGTGELYSLTPAEHAEVVRATVEEIAGACPVVAGVGFNLRLGAELAKRSAELGADAVLALPPYYPHADDEALLDYYSSLGAATPLPLLVYSRDWVNPGPAWVEKLAATTPTLTAWKDGQADIRKLAPIMHRLGDRLHWIGGAGDDAVPAYYSIGIRTYTSSIATVAPKLALALHEVAARGDYAALAELQRRFVTPLYSLRSRRKGYEVSAMKAMMDDAGLVGGAVRPPLPEVRPAEREELRAMLAEWREWL